MIICGCSLVLFFFKLKSAYELRISDWSSDVCSSDLRSQVMAHQGYYNTGHAALAVDAAVIERLVTAGYPKDFDPDGIECQVVLNTKENWEVILGAVVATPKEQPKPLYKGAR